MPTSNDNAFLVPKGDYKRLIAFQKSECIYDITLYFVDHYLADPSTPIHSHKKQ